MSDILHIFPKNHFGTSSNENYSYVPLHDQDYPTREDFKTSINERGVSESFGTFFTITGPHGKRGYSVKRGTDAQGYPIISFKRVSKIFENRAKIKADGLTTGQVASLITSNIPVQYAPSGAVKIFEGTVHRSKKRSSSDIPFIYVGGLSSETRFFQHFRAHRSEFSDCSIATGYAGHGKQTPVTLETCVIGKATANGEKIAVVLSGNRAAATIDGNQASDFNADKLREVGVILLKTFNEFITKFNGTALSTAALKLTMQAELICLNRLLEAHYSEASIHFAATLPIRHLDGELQLVSIGIGNVGGFLVDKHMPKQIINPRAQLKIGINGRQYDAPIAFPIPSLGNSDLVLQNFMSFDTSTVDGLADVYIFTGLVAGTFKNSTNSIRLKTNDGDRHIRETAFSPDKIALNMHVRTIAAHAFKAPQDDSIESPSDEIMIAQIHHSPPKSKAHLMSVSVSDSDDIESDSED